MDVVNKLKAFYMGLSNGDKILLITAAIILAAPQFAFIAAMATLLFFGYRAYGAFKLS